MAEKLTTPVIYLKLGTPAIELYSDTKKLSSPLIRLVDVSGNILESCKVTSPHGREDECAKFIISDIEDAYGLRDIMTIGTEYTLSFWMKSDVSGYVRTSGEGTFKASSEWQKCVVTFNAEAEDLVLSFDREGTYYIYHIQLELGNMATDYRPANEDVDEGISTAQQTAEDAQKAADKNARDMASNVLKFNQDIKGLQDQLDANVTIWYGEVTPSISNEPAVNWKDNDTRDLHIGDMYYDTKTGYAYRWNHASGMYSWEKIEDQDVVKALKDAAKAQDTADKKRRVFIAQPVPPYDEGDLWLNDGNLFSCVKDKAEGAEYEETDFEKAVRYIGAEELQTWIDGDYADDLEYIKGQIDGKAETWCQTTDPSLEWDTEDKRRLHIGDLWLNPNTKESYIYIASISDRKTSTPADNQLEIPYIGLYSWEPTFEIPQQVFDDIDGKAQIFAVKPTKDYHENDLYVEGPPATDEEGNVITDEEGNVVGGDIYVCIRDYNPVTADFDKDWKLASKYTDDTRADAAHNRLDGAVEDMLDADGNPVYEDWSHHPVYKRSDNTYYYINALGEQIDVLVDDLIWLNENNEEVEYDVNNANLKLKVFQTNNGVIPSLTDIETTIRKTAKEIGMMVRSEYALKGDTVDENGNVIEGFEGLQIRLNTFLGTPDGFEMTFKQFYERTLKDSATQSGKWEEQEDYIRFTNAGNIELGSRDADTKAILTQTRLAFFVDGSEVAYFSNSKLVVKEIALERQLTYFNSWATRPGAYIDSVGAYNLNDVFLGPSIKELFAPIIDIVTE